MPQDRTTSNKDRKKGWATKAAEAVSEIDTRIFNDEETRRSTREGTERLLKSLGKTFKDGKLIDRADL